VYAAALAIYWRGRVRSIAKGLYGCCRKTKTQDNDETC
jgi:hypothetical protein